MITRIKLKDKLIEFQLGGGGYGTAGDDTDTSAYVASVPKSIREKTLEREPEKSANRLEGHLKVTNATFARPDQRVDAQFVEGVLVRYSISSRKSAAACC